MSHCPGVSGVYFTKEGNRVQEDSNVPLTEKPHLLASPFVDVRVSRYMHMPLSISLSLFFFPFGCTWQHVGP